MKKSLHNQRLRLSHNFMLRHVQTGFEIWSSVSRSYHILSLDLVLLLISFSSGQKVRNVIAGKEQLGDALDISRAIRWLYQNGLLILVRQESMQSDTHIESGAEITATSDHAATPREPTCLNNRVPIYFVPHMPNHYPLALGMIHSFINSYNDGCSGKLVLLV